jgi:hypothetical protein
MSNKPVGILGVNKVGGELKAKLAGIEKPVSISLITQAMKKVDKKEKADAKRPVISFNRVKQLEITEEFQTAFETNDVSSCASIIYSIWLTDMWARCPKKAKTSNLVFAMTFLNLEKYCDHQHFQVDVRGSLLDLRYRQEVAFKLLFPTPCPDLDEDDRAPHCYEAQGWSKLRYFKMYREFLKLDQARNTLLRLIVSKSDFLPSVSLGSNSGKIWEYRKVKIVINRIVKESGVTTEWNREL